MNISNCIINLRRKERNYKINAKTEKFQANLELIRWNYRKALLSQKESLVQMYLIRNRLKLKMLEVLKVDNSKIIAGKEFQML